MTFQPTIAAVFSLFNPDSSVVSNVELVLKQVNTVIVVDDGSTADISGVLDQLQTLGCLVHRMESNSGIAAALNAGISTALSTVSVQPDLILTMDQDSTLNVDYVATLIKAYESAQKADLQVGMVAPGTVEGLPSRSTGKQGAVVFGDEPIQSGLLIPTTVFQNVGTFMADLFIDGVDSEFYLRVKAAGYRVILAPGASLNHSLGSMVPARILGLEPQLRGKPLLVRTAATMRYYYIYRNKLLLAARYWRTNPQWVLRGVLLDMRHLAIVTLMVPGRMSRLHEVSAGIADGFKGRTGRKDGNL